MFPVWKTKKSDSVIRSESKIRNSTPRFILKRGFLSKNGALWTNRVRELSSGIIRNIRKKKLWRYGSGLLNATEKKSAPLRGECHKRKRLLVCCQTKLN